MNKLVRRTFTAVILLLLSASFAMAASLTIKSGGGGNYTISGDNMDGVAGIDLIVTYDKSSLSSPSVSQGSLVSGALFAANPNFSANTIKIAIISTKTFTGSGPIATIKFSTLRSNPAMPSFTSSLIDSKGAAISGSIIPGSDASTTTSPQQETQQTSGGGGATSSTTTAPPSGSSSSTALGSVNIAPDAFLKSETKPAEPAGTPVTPPAENESTTTAAAPPAEQPVVAKSEEPKKAEEVKVTTYNGVVERFRTYQGEKSPAILVALFKKEIAPTIRQEPPVALSDGKTNVRIIATLSSPDGKSPNFALNGAKLVSLKKDEDSDKWIVEALPLEKSLKVSLTILNGHEVIEFPLTVAPALNNISVSEAGFTSFLKNKSVDLNGDGTHDYIDDFIYTANYLVRMDKTKPADKTKP